MENEIQVIEPTALQAITEAEINQQIATAKRFPRVLSKVREKIFELATMDEDTAKKCWYALPRDGKVIQGPSIRLAEIVVSSYQNLRAGTRHISTDDKTATCQAICMDLENNVAVTTELKVKIASKNGVKYSDDMIVTTINAGCSKVLRNAIFKIVPMSLFKSVLDRVKKVGMGDERTFGETRKAIVAKLISLGAKEKQICDLMDVRTVGDMTMEHVSTLQGLITAIEEETTTIKECFDMKTGKPDVAMPTEKVPDDKKAEPKTPLKTVEKTMDEKEYTSYCGTIVNKLYKQGWQEMDVQSQLVRSGFMGDWTKAEPQERKKVIALLGSFIELEKK